MAYSLIESAPTYSLTPFEVALRHPVVAKEALIFESKRFICWRDFCEYLIIALKDTRQTSIVKDMIEFLAQARACKTAQCVRQKLWQYDENFKKNGYYPEIFTLISERITCRS